MAKKETNIHRIVRLTARKFRSFGGGHCNVSNPLSFALKDGPPQFAAGVNIEDVVRFVLSKRNRFNWDKRRGLGDDYRDYINTAYDLRSLSSTALKKVLHLKRRDLKKRLKNRHWPFSKLSKKSAVMLSGLPSSWISGAAQHRLDRGLFRR